MVLRMLFVMLYLLDAYVSKRKTSVPLYMCLRGPLSRSWCRGFRNFSVCEKWKIVPGSETSSRPRTLNCPPYTFSPFGSFAFKYSSKIEREDFLLKYVFGTFHCLLTSEINASCCEDTDYYYGDSDTNEPFLVRVNFL